MGVQVRAALDALSALFRLIHAAGVTRKVALSSGRIALSDHLILRSTSMPLSLQTGISIAEALSSKLFTKSVEALMRSKALLLEGGKHPGSGLS